MPLYGNFGEDVRDENDKRPLLREDERPAPARASFPVGPTTYYRSVTERRPPPTDDLATRVAADLFVRHADFTGDSENTGLAGQCVRLGRIFAEAVAKEGK